MRSLLLLAVIAGCAREPVKNSLSLRSAELFSLETHGLLTDPGIHFHPEGSKYVYFLDKKSAALLRLDLENTSLIRLGDFRVENVEGQTGFYVSEKDKTFTVCYTDSSVTRNFNGSSPAVLSYNELVNDGYIFPVADFLPLERNGKLYISHFSDVKGDYLNPAYFASPVEAEVDLRTGKTRFVGQYHPQNYRNNCYSFGSDAARLELAPNVHAYVFPHNDSIFIRNLETNQLTTLFFGSRTHKNFQYIPFDEVGKVNESAFVELARANPFYVAPGNYPLAGYFTRELVIPPRTEGGKYRQVVVFYDRNFNYIGEAPLLGAWMLDSKNGLLGMEMKGSRLIISKLSW